MKLPDGIAAFEIKGELRKWINRHHSGKGSPRWAIFEELRFGMGLGGRDERSMARTLTGSGLSLAAKDALRDRLVADQFDSADNPESRIDVFAIDTWAGNDGKHERRAFEIKVNRSDLLSELRTPTKRLPWLGVVNAFNIVAPEGLTTADEIEERAPECGLIIYGRRPERPDTAICSCNNQQTDVQWHHGFGCDFKEALRAYERGRSFTEVKPAIALDGGEPSWGLVASILRQAS
jgi:hypothetical protein